MTPSTAELKPPARKQTQTGGTTPTIKLRVAEFSQALQTVGNAVPARSPNPAMLNVLISGDGSLTATDGELFITARLPDAEGEAMLLPHARLLQIVKSCDQTGEIKLRLNGSTCAISCGKGNWSLPTASVSSFPIEAHGKPKPMARLPADQFKAMLSQVKFAIDDKSGRPGLNGMLAEFKDGTLSFVASDSRRLSCAQAEIDQACDNSSAIIPKRAVDVLWKLANAAETVQLEVAASQMLVTLDSTVVWVRLLSGQFIDWRKLTPDRDVQASVVTAGELLHACIMASVCTSDESRGVDVSLLKSGISMCGKSSDRGTSSATCSLLELGLECSVRLDPQHVIEWLWPLDSAAAVEIEADGGNSAVVLKCDDNYAVIMPLSNP